MQGLHEASWELVQPTPCHVPWTHSRSHSSSALSWSTSNPTSWGLRFSVCEILPWCSKYLVRAALLCNHLLSPTFLCPDLPKNSPWAPSPMVWQTHSAGMEAPLLMGPDFPPPWANLFNFWAQRPPTIFLSHLTWPRACPQPSGTWRMSSLHTQASLPTAYWICSDVSSVQTSMFIPTRLLAHLPGARGHPVNTAVRGSLCLLLRGRSAPFFCSIWSSDSQPAPRQTVPEETQGNTDKSITVMTHSIHLLLPQAAHVSVSLPQPWTNDKTHKHRPDLRTCV